MSLKFGTDGVRGIANRELTPELALNLGRAAARVLGGSRWLIGRDTRRSGPLLAAALSAGLATEGVEVVDLGVVPTPGVAYLSATDRVPAAMISASHNPFGDNGIKLFSAGGVKLSDELEQRLELELTALSTQGDPRPRPAGAEVGSISVDHRAIERYRRHLVEGVVPAGALTGLKVVLDGANGAASELAAGVFEELGATVVAIHVEPDGININEDCGSTHPEGLQAAVVAHGADVGLAFDGDADRVLASDADGEFVDGDQIIAICAIDRHERGRLAHDTVVVTVMSNLGFRQGMAAHGITVVTTDVGDRYVLEALDEGQHCLGGEQSGHVIFRDLASTGDGMLTGIALLSVMARRGRPLAELASAAMVRLPQVLVNVRTAHRDPGLLARLQPEVTVAEHRLGERGRVLLRASGTEPVVRVMVEAPTHDEAAAVAGHLAASVTALST
ncbi:phosphoglucosamine mutase [Aquihabitans sp. McL0605]|uniref:phosphoglucosamine mutase n=1 Tax=Aquihabitans sp. McL0605 TaxID=3415671 RepID=UPI003CEB32FD